MRTRRAVSAACPPKRWRRGREEDLMTVNKSRFLAEDKLGRLEALLQSEREAEVRPMARAELVAPPIVRVPRDTVLPLSFAQQRIWFLDQLEPGNTFYNVPTVIRLRGNLDLAALQKSLDEIIRRHEVLRTTFASVDGEPAQIVGPAESLRLPLTDLSSADEAERELHARRFIEEEARRPFDLSQGPFIRAFMLRLGDEEHILLLNMHHAVTDAWSSGVFMRELAALYEAFIGGRPSPLPELGVQYADYAVWQRQWLQGEVLDSQLSYWRERLGGDLPTLELPTDRPHPTLQTSHGAKYSFALPKPLSEGLKELTRREGATLFMTLLAGLKTLFHRYTGQTDISIGSSTANRSRPELEGLIGFFVNTLVMRADLSGDPTFHELLG